MILIAETPRLKDALQEERELIEVMRLATLEIRAASAEAADVVPGRTLVSWQDSGGNPWRGVLVDIEFGQKVTARPFRKDGTLGRRHRVAPHLVTVLDGQWSNLQEVKGNGWRPIYEDSKETP